MRIFVLVKQAVSKTYGKDHYASKSSRCIVNGKTKDRIKIIREGGECRYWSLIHPPYDVMVKSYCKKVL